MKAKTTAVVVILTLAGAAPAALAQDVLKLRAGGEAKGKISQLTASKVVYTDSAGKTATLKAEDVVDITFSDTPASLKAAMGAVSSKNWEKALAQCETALSEIGPGKARDFHKAYVNFTWALAFEGKAQPDKALEKLRAVRSEGGDHRLRPDSFQKSLDIARKAGDSALESVLGEMEREPDPAIAGGASLERARMKYAKGEFDAAAGLYAKLSGSFTAEGRLGKLRCLRALKKQDEVETLCGQILGDKVNSTPALLQSAAASLGDSLLKKAGADREKLAAALRTCAQAIAMGPPASKETSIAEDYVLALLNAARSCAQLSKAVDKPEAKGEYRDRAIRYYGEVISNYRSTEWATTAQKERGAVSGEEKPKTP